MQWLFFLLPGFLSASFTEKLENRTFSPFQFLKQVCIYDLFINLFSCIIYHYIIRTQESILENFQYNTFLIHFTILNIILSLLIPVIYFSIKPWFSVYIEKKSSTESKTDESKK